MLIYPVFIPFLGCPFKCIYCDQNQITQYHSITIDLQSIRKFIDKHGFETEIAFFGGTFTALPVDQQKSLFNQIQQMFDQPVSFRISTRPDCIDDTILEFLKNQNVTTIELGIQSFSDQVLIKSQRGYTREGCVQACTKIKEAGFKLCVQLMPGLPGGDFNELKKTIDDTLQIKPDYVRLYPVIVLKNTFLEKLYNRGEYLPLTVDQAVEALLEACEVLTGAGIDIIKIGLHSDLDTDSDSVVAGPWFKNIGEVIRGILFLKQFNEKRLVGKTLKISGYERSMILGNHGFVINFMKNKGFKLPEKIIVDNHLKKGETIIM